MNNYKLKLQRVIRTGEEPEEASFWEEAKLDKIPQDRLYEYPAETGKEGFYKILEANPVYSESKSQALGTLPLQPWDKNSNGATYKTNTNITGTAVYDPTKITYTTIPGWTPIQAPSIHQGSGVLKPLGQLIYSPAAEPTKQDEPGIDNAAYYLQKAQEALQARAKLRDNPAGERSVKSTVEAFNALTGRDLTEQEGWEFMLLLKMVRGRQGKFNADDYIDGSAYFALLGEANAKKEI